MLWAIKIYRTAGHSRLVVAPVDFMLKSLYLLEMFHFFTAYGEFFYYDIYSQIFSIPIDISLLRGKMDVLRHFKTHIV